MKIGDIAEVIVGVVPTRKRANYKTDKTNQYELFNLRTYESRQNEDKIPYEEFISEEDLSSYVVHKDDLLLRLAFPLKVIIVDDELDGKLITNQYVSIRMDVTKYNPGFLKWYLESNDLRHQLEKYIVGTAIRTIPVVKIREILLPNVNINTQEELGKLVRCWEAQKKRYNYLIAQKELYYNSIIETIINEKEDKNYE